MLMPSETEIVVNSRGVPPASATPSEGMKFSLVSRELIAVRTRRSPTSYAKPRDRVSSRAPGGRSCISPRNSRAERIILTGGQDR